VFFLFFVLFCLFFQCLCFNIHFLTHSHYFCLFLTLINSFFLSLSLALSLCSTSINTHTLLMKLTHNHSHIHVHTHTKSDTNRRYTTISQFIQEFMTLFLLFKNFNTISHFIQEFQHYFSFYSRISTLFLIVFKCLPYVHTYLQSLENDRRHTRDNDAPSYYFWTE